MLRLRLLGLAFGAMLLPFNAQAQRLDRFPFEQLPVTIRAVHSDKCLEVAGGGGQDAPLQQFTCGEQENQTWFLIWAGGADYQFRPGHRGNVRLAIENESLAPGARALLTNLELDSELFRFVTHSDNTVEIVNSRSGKCLDVFAGSMDDGGAVQQEPCTGAMHERFRLSVRARPFHLIARHSTKCLEVVGSSMANGAAIQQSACLGSQQDNQDWIVQAAGTSGNVTLWTVRAEHSGRCLTADLESPVLFQTQCDGSVMQRWAFVTDDEGYVHIETATGACIAIVGAAMGDGAPARTAACTPGDEQRFFWARNVRRHLAVIHPATTAGADRLVSVNADMVALTASANAVYRRYGIELLYDSTTDIVPIDSDGLWNLGIATNWTNTFACMTQRRGFLINDMPRECAARYARRFPDRVMVVIGASSAAGFSNGEQRFIFYRATTPLGLDPCGLGLPFRIHFPHEVGHYFGLSHVGRTSFPNAIAAGTAFVNAGNNPAIFDNDHLADTFPDPGVAGTDCRAPAQPTVFVSLQIASGTFTLFVPFIVQVDNVMSPPYFNVAQAITLQQAEIVRATAYANSL